MHGKKKYQLLLIGFITFLFLFRILLFAGMYGGVEHDSGWFLGVAKNLALRGIYASYTNTVAQEGTGAFPSIFKRFSVQDAQGFVYFPAAVTVGPGYIIPEAIIIKLFGSGFWQYRAWPLISFTLMLLLSFLVVWRLGGLLTLLIFSGWLWIIPQFTTQFAYEAFSEDIAFLYLLAGFSLLYISHKKNNSLLTAFFAGICIALSFLTKTLFLLPIIGFLVFTYWDYFRIRMSKKLFLKKWLVFLFGALIPIAFFYSYEYMYVMSHFGQPGWNAIMEDNRLIFLQAGSGIRNLSSFFLQNPLLLYSKYLIWMDVGTNLPCLFWLTFFLSPFIFLRYLKNGEKMFCCALYVASFVSFFWFLFFATDAWGRYIWQGLYMGIMLICITLGLSQKNLHLKNKQGIWIIVILLFIIAAYANYPALTVSPILTESTISTWAKIRIERGIDLNGFPSNILISLQDQQQVISYFESHINKNDRVYYIAGYLNAEVATLVDKVFYPLQRYDNVKQINPSDGNSYVIVGPYQQGYWSPLPVAYVQQVKSQLCKKIVFENNSYMLCLLKKFVVKT